MGAPSVHVRGARGLLRCARTACALPRLPAAAQFCHADIAPRAAAGALGQVFHACSRAQMASDPQLVFGFQRGSQLIPYDPPQPEAAEEEADDDEYAAYYGSGV